MSKKMLQGAVLGLISIFCLGLSFQPSDLTSLQSLPVSQTAETSNNGILIPDFTTQYPQPELETVLPQGVFPYLFLNPGERIDIQKPQILKGEVLRLGEAGLNAEKILLQAGIIEDLKQAELNEISLLPEEHRDILSQLLNYP